MKRTVILSILSLVGLIAFAPVQSGTPQQSGQTGGGNTYPIVQPRIPVQPRPSISGRNDPFNKSSGSNSSQNNQQEDNYEPIDYGENAPPEEEQAEQSGSEQEA